MYYLSRIIAIRLLHPFILLSFFSHVSHMILSITCYPVLLMTLVGLEKRKRELGIHSSIGRSSNIHDGEDDDNGPRRYSANKLNNISEGMTLNTSSRYTQNAFHDDESTYVVGGGSGSGGGRGSGLTATTTMNPLHTQNVV